MLHRHSHRFLICSLVLVTIAIGLAFHNSTWAGASDTRYDFGPARIAMLSITMRESLFHVSMLAADDFKGRETGKPGQWLAAKYIAKEFAKYDLLAVGDQGKYYQNFQIALPSLQQAQLKLQFDAGKKPYGVKFSLVNDFIPLSFTGENTVSAPVVFVGYGITAPEFNYDDYQDLDVKDKIVLVMRHEPQENNPNSPFNGVRLTPYGLLLQKARNAIAHGAKGMLIVTDPNGGHLSSAPQGFWPSLIPQRANDEQWELLQPRLSDDFPALWVHDYVANQILSAAGFTLSDLQESIDQTLSPRSFQIDDLEVQLSVSLHNEVRKTQNVLGLLQGSDPDLRDEVVVIGAHYDHIGTRHGLVYNGADDNASGVAGILEIAEAFTEMGIHPRRSILFAAFSAEELGLLGSEYYVNHPVIPLDKTVAMLNLDMISRNNPNNVMVIGSHRSPQLHDINEAANAQIGLHLLYNGEEYFSRSDQANFAKHRIPVLFYHTDSHDDYHQATDDVQKINPEKLARISRLAFLVAWEVANLDQRPTFRWRGD